MTLTVEAPLEPFRPGQFMNIGLPNGDEPIFRAYSLASAPGAPLEVFLSEVESGAVSPSLFHMAVGDPVLIDPMPHGFFTLDWVPDAKELWLVATGTGLGPFISMLRSGEPFRRFEHVVVAHGVRRIDHLAYADELHALAAQVERRLTWVPIVSREQVPPDMLAGRLTSALVDGRLERAAGRALDPARAHLMLCGNPAMIDEMLDLLGQRGLRRHRARKPGHVTVEKYWE
jgi:ferredoxin--NADP+ reductase